VNRLTENINRMLNLAKLESKSYMGEFVVSDIVKTVNQFLEENGHLFKGCRITVHSSENRRPFTSGSTGICLKCC
jgi:two-component system phosphate regulon sensor histidine kinase PhoR